MNVTLVQDEISCFALALHTALTREETLEMIVPDACPDIVEIVDTDAAVHLRGKECAEGCVTLHGAAPCSVLYRPEGETGLRQLRAELPIQFTADLEGVTGQSRCVLLPRVTLAETRAVNPRKILIRVGLSFDLTAYEPTVLRCCTGVEDRETLGIEARTEQHSGAFAVHVGEKVFPYADEVQIPGSKPPMEELLRARCRPFCTESRLLGGKLVFKGGTAIQLLYLSPEGQLCTADFELPFSQIADVGPVAEGADFQVECVVTGSEIYPLDGEGRGLSVELELLAQIVVRETRALSVVTDAYSIHHAAAPEFAACLLPQLVERGLRRQTVREVIETAALPQGVCDVRAYVSQVTVGGGELTAELRLAVLYQTDEGGFAQALRQTVVKCPVEREADTLCVAACTVPEVDASAAPGGVEVRLGVDFQLLLLRQSRVFGLSAFALNTDQPLDQEGQPSIVLRQMAQGESLWEIAKTYLTTQAEIEQANGLEGEPAAPGQMLLIPRKR
ncbi:MAG: DUF3794 domain-containing protein [Clostridiales bacterium]|nr:DUF3794 domain-containing protein [Clostridiales bacterium]